MNLSGMQWLNVAAFMLAGLAGWTGWSDLLDPKTASVVASGIGIAVSGLNFIVSGKAAVTTPGA